MLHKNISYTAIVVVLVMVLFGFPSITGIAQADEIFWSEPVNLSNTPERTSSDPFLLSDPAGKVHLFWAEKVGDAPGNQPDTMIYTSWDGASWSMPQDIFFSPMSDGNPTLVYPRGVLDENGTIHLIWLSLPFAPYYALNYSSVYSPDAGNAADWKQPVKLAEDLTGTKYSADIAYNPAQGLHIVYARSPHSGPIGDNLAVSYIYSMDYGSTWSEPVDIYTAKDLGRGVSDVRVLLDPPENIYTSWTEWDETGNGQVVYFMRSLDNGKTWDDPIPLDVRIGNEYERDWNNMALLGPRQIVSIWEGGLRAYRHAQYSYDAGATWTEPVDTFPWLIGDNGSVEFVKDSEGMLHTFVASRIREGNESRGELFGLWHSSWEGGRRWREPILAGGTPGMTNPKVALINGNQIVAVWYGSQIYEIMVMTGEILNASAITPVPWPIRHQFIDGSAQAPQATEILTTTPLIPTPTPLPDTSINQQSSISSMMVFTLLPSIAIITLIIVVRKYRKNAGLKIR